MSPRPRQPGQKDLPPNLYRKEIKGVIYYQYRNPANGRYIGLGTNKETAISDAVAANAIIYKAARQKRIDAISQPSGLTLRGYLSQYWRLLTENPRRPLSPNTLRGKNWVINQVRGHRNSHIPIASIEVIHISEILKEYTSRQKNRAAQAMRSGLVDIFKHALAEGVRPAAAGNPAALTLMPVAKVARARLTLDQFNLIFEVARKMDPWVGNAMLLGIVTAQRREDIARMRFKDVSDGWLHVVQGKTKTPLRLSLSIRLDVIGLSIGEVIARCRDQVLSPTLLHHTRATNMSRPGDAVHRDTISRKFSEARKATGLTWDGSPPTYHEIRSLAARLYGAQGRDAQHLLGHTDPETTAVYQDTRGYEWVEVS